MVSLKTRCFLLVEIATPWNNTRLHLDGSWSTHTSNPSLQVVQTRNSLQVAVNTSTTPQYTCHLRRHNNELAGFYQSISQSVHDTHYWILTLQCLNYHLLMFSVSLCPVTMLNNCIITRGNHYTTSDIEWQKLDYIYFIALLRIRHYTGYKCSWIPLARTQEIPTNTYIVK